MSKTSQFLLIDKAASHWSRVTRVATALFVKSLYSNAQRGFKGVKAQKGCFAALMGSLPDGGNVNYKSYKTVQLPVWATASYFSFFTIVALLALIALLGVGN